MEYFTPIRLGLIIILECWNVRGAVEEGRHRRADRRPDAGQTRPET